MGTISSSYAVTQSQEGTVRVSPHNQFMKGAPSMEIHQLVQQWDKCLNVNGDYVEV
jgi:hypothetical protein